MAGMRVEIPMNGETHGERCVICGGKVGRIHAQRNENICEKCWYRINKENTK